MVDERIYKIAICDDCQTDIDYLTLLLNHWENQYHHQLKITSFNSAESFLFDYEMSKDVDVLLLDIEMGEMDGVRLAKIIRKDNEYMQIIFITGYSDYIAEGYEVSALHYLLKPVKEDKFFEVLERAFTKCHQNEAILTLNYSNQMVRIPFYEIRYMEVNQNYVTVHAKKDYKIKKTLGEFEQILDHRFYRMGRSYLLNLTCISRVTKKEVYLLDGTILPLPRGQYEPLNRAIIKLD